MTFNIIEYTKSNIWIGNPYLVHNLTGVKKCSVCQKLKYSIEFADFDSFADGKVPCCTKCARSRKLQEQIIELLKDYQQQCKRCEETKSIGEFIARSGDWYQIHRYCNSCRSGLFQEALDTDISE